MRYVIICVLTALAVLTGSLLTLGFYPPPTLEIEGVAWCYEGHYNDIDDVPSLPSSIVDVVGGGVRVFVPC
jgi:hypothetical protein